MKTIKGALLLACGMLLFAAASAQAQVNCNLCDPYGPCYTDCWYCDFEVDPEYGYCPEYAYHVTTCGERMGACTQENCTPNWTTTDRVTVGQYGETTYGILCSPWPYCYPTFGCDHHVVDRVTQHDNNECNLSSYYNDRQFCDDYVSFSLPHQVSPIPNCCAYPYFCNDWHSCF